MSKNIGYVIHTILLIISILTPTISNSQETERIKNRVNSYSIDLFAGAQLSGIREEDFIKENITPYINIIVGRKVNSFLTLTLGYQGPYFNYIGDNYKHKYFYLDISSITNLNKLLNIFNNKFWRINVIIGTGVLNNDLHNKLNWCLSGAIAPEIVISNNYSLKIKAGGIAGLSIYQHDKDMLLNLSLGLTRYF